MAGPLPGGDKQAMIDAYGAAKAENAPPDAGPDASAGAPPDDMGGQEQLGADPEMKSLQLQVQHIEHLLLRAGIAQASDFITPPMGGAPPMAPPPGPPMGGPPAGAPPGGPPLQ